MGFAWRPGASRDGRRRIRAGLAWLVAIVLVGVVVSDARGPRPIRPNVVLILADALRAANLPFYGYFRDTAPRLGAIAARGTVFERHFANYPGTPVSVSQMLTGRLMSPLLLSPHRIQREVKAPPPDLLVLPRVLRRFGYRTAVVTPHPFFSGARPAELFDERHLVPTDPGTPSAAFEKLMPSVRAFLRSAREEGAPFFLYVHAMDTHQPLSPHPGFDRFPEGPAPPGYDAYDQNIRYVDHWVGVIADELEAGGLADRTIFVFTADHGEEHGELGPERWNAGHGYTLREAQLHVPLVVRVPGDPRPGRRYPALTSHVDLAPTLMRLAVPDFDAGRFRFDGADLSAFWRNGESGPGPDRSVIAYSMRHWALYQEDVAVIEDLWTGSVDAYRHVPDRYNYPVPIRVEGPASREKLARRLSGERERLWSAFLRLPPVEPGSARGRIGIPIWLEVSRGRATYEQRADDDLWHLDLWMLLEAAPGERPGPITMAVPWAPGRYRIRIRLDEQRVLDGYRNHVLVELPDAGGVGVRVSGYKGGRPLIDLGVFDIGSVLRLRLSEPEGGVAINGFQVQPVDAVGSVVPEPEVEESLRALGYLR